MGAPDPERQPESRGPAFLLRATTLVLLVPALIVTGWGAFNLQGYQNDPQSGVFQTWPVGVASLALAASLTWLAIRPSGNQLQKIVTSAAFVVFVLSWISVLN